MRGERGLLRAGYFADINVIDPERIQPELPEVVSDHAGLEVEFE